MKQLWCWPFDLKKENENGQYIIVVYVHMTFLDIYDVWNLDMNSSTNSDWIFYNSLAMSSCGWSYTKWLILN